MLRTESYSSIEDFSSSWSSIDDSMSSSQDGSLNDYGENDYTDLYGTTMAAAENMTVCDKDFPVEELFYFDMPCRQDEIAIQRPDIFGPDPPPRTVGQSCPKYEHEKEYFCHFKGCSGNALSNSKSTYVHFSNGSRVFEHEKNLFLKNLELL